MRKMALILLVLVFSGIGFAEKAKIVDPPRPSKEYKFLLILEHGNDLTVKDIHKHIIHTDRYSIVNEGGGMFLKVGPPNETCAAWYDEQSCSPIPIVRSGLTYSLSGFETVKFLKAKAPKPKKKEDKKKTAVKKLPQPQKAKVVFTEKQHPVKLGFYCGCLRLYGLGLQLMA